MKDFRDLFGKVDPVFADGGRMAYSGDDGHAAVARLGSFSDGRNRWGVEDLVGNVWQWVSSTEDGKAVLKGGDFFTFARVERASELSVAVDPTLVQIGAGVRCVKDIPKDWKPAVPAKDGR